MAGSARPKRLRLLLRVLLLGGASLIVLGVGGTVFERVRERTDARLVITLTGGQKKEVFSFTRAP